MTFARYLFALLFLAIVLQAAYYFPHLPEKMATHFDSVGAPNGWMSKEWFFWINGSILAVLSLGFIALPIWIRRLPNALINLPNKDYWLAPERRDASMAFIVEQMAWLGNACLMLFVSMFEMVYRANVDGSFHLPGVLTWVLLGVYLVAMLGLVVWMLVRFRLPVDAR